MREDCAFMKSKHCVALNKTYCKDCDRCVFYQSHEERAERDKKYGRVIRGMSAEEIDWHDNVASAMQRYNITYAEIGKRAKLEQMYVINIVRGNKKSAAAKPKIYQAINEILKEKQANGEKVELLEE